MDKKHAKRTILSKLLQALVRESIFNKESIKICKIDNSIEITLQDESKLIALIDSFNSFERFDLLSDLQYVSQQGVQNINHPLELLQLLKDNSFFDQFCSKDNFNNFCEEINNSLSNLILAEISYELIKNEYQKSSQESNVKSSLQWIQLQKTLNCQFSPLSFYEQCVIQGHPLHPSAKTKIGFDIEELISYSPEWRNVVSLELVAVKKSHCKLTLLEGYSFSDLLFKEYPIFIEKIKIELENKGVDFINYDFVPVHPWQRKNLILHKFKTQIADLKIIPLKSVNIPSLSMVSFRSFAPEQSIEHKRHHIKTTLNLLSPSDFGLLSSKVTEYAPRVSKMLQSIQRDLKGFQTGQFRIHAEVSGVSYIEYSDKFSKIEKEELSQNLSCLLRENPEDNLKANEVCLPAAALLEKSPISGKSIMVEFIEEYCEKCNYTLIEQAAKSFFKKYISLSIPSLLTLLSRYGLSLSAHLQNCVPVFSRGEPVAFFIRDFSHIRIYKERLEKQNFTLNLISEDAPIFCKNICTLHKNLFYSFFQNNIGEIIIDLYKNYSISEKELWNEVKQVCQETFATLKIDPLIQLQALEDEEDLFKETIQMKAMTKMRLNGGRSDYLFVGIKNPMSDLELFE
ncbi:IucA/IucC family protein [Fluviispira multicolorata]|uniref:IucA/IucC family protein n=1 Tax=Fluviispira multicolorata TaxID=2654512 RepID=UPI0013756F42|nr:IucA/IucC family protein [Fluviispira multicolorata]